ncbi:MAG TPA: hypothetical protein ENH94_05595 [Phycisphaerales bacterium]|nr:hypothetical protein [Phycisphaerales bacterium]
MTTTIIFSLLFVLVVYLSIGLTIGRRTKGVADLLPLGQRRQACVKNSAEFSSSTVATSISFATVIMAFFELAGYFGIWLLWTVVTTVAGLFVVRVFAKRIWEKMSTYERRPTLHEFLGDQFNSPALARVGAICTSLGFLGAFATELTVGSKFFAGLIPTVHPWTIVIVLSTVAFLYTAFGGFRAVIVTDRVQMLSIWLLLVSLSVFYVYYALTHGGWSISFSNIPASTLRFSVAGRAGLLSFMVGIFVINVPSFISDMSVWQRIAGAEERKTVTVGLWSGVSNAAITWTVLVLLACFVFMIVRPAEGINPLISLINVIGNTGGFFAISVMFITVLGLYGAMLSTASTQLIAVSHTLYVDVFSYFARRPLKESFESRSQLNISRLILVLAAVISTVLVQLLSQAGFSVADLVFAIFGAQLGLCPLVIMALLIGKDKLKVLSGWAVIAVSIGFIAGWGTAVFAKLTGRDSLVFMAPVCSLVASSFLLAVGVALAQSKKVMAGNVNWILIRSVLAARKNKLYRLVTANKPMRLECLKDACSVCCNVIGTPLITEEEAAKIGAESVMENKNAKFIRSERCVCSLLKDGLCSIHPVRPKGCREYPWYNVNGKLYYDRGCPGVKYDRDERPDVNDIQPFEGFFPHTPKHLVWLIKRICLN